MKKKVYKYTEKEFIKAVAESYSISQVLKQLSLNPSGANYSSFHKKVKELSLDTSHFTGQGHLLGKTHNWSKTIPLKDVLVENSTYNRTSLKARLIKNGTLKNVCSNCGISQWNGKEISLHLEHINGINNDNRIENLCLLCPNCHSQTDTYAGKNIGKWAKYIKRRSKSINEGNKKEPRESSVQKSCCDCGKKIDPKATRCKSCVGFIREATKIEWPSVEALIQMVDNSSYLAVGRKLKVSDNAVRKRIRMHKDRE